MLPSLYNSLDHDKRLPKYQKSVSVLRPVLCEQHTNDAQNVSGEHKLVVLSVRNV